MFASLARMSEDTEWAVLASADEVMDVADDEDCADVRAMVEKVTADVSQLMQQKVLRAKAALAQKAQGRQAQVLAHAASERALLEQAIDDEVAARLSAEERLEKARIVQARLAEALFSAREDNRARMNAYSVMNEWQRSLAAVKRDTYGERIAPRHYAKTLLRSCLGRWRSAARKLRHARIDAFWERSVIELRGALAGFYEPKLEALEAQIHAANADAAAAWQAKDDLGVQLKAAFMRSVGNLNLETTKLLGPAEEALLASSADRPGGSASLQPPPLPAGRNATSATARRGVKG